MHCCICTGICGHTGGPTYCFFHEGGKKYTNYTPNIIIQPTDTFQFVPSGWCCPKCDRVYAPAVTECTHCNKDK